ncbi:MetQ/NlpA family ABC transporter substrate-binding protein [uncultured Oscillibacter sp.]|uniref:MetQ/NlpA family ABC transporter substrate-binding protein n=1 Tax=uncultured Oscillibacter sp. TaxID=876091 RepID=UPI0025E9E2E5|nr:MetQ/NlpA family ABC transporter substrate-binding protein [uncultured Oscillibacter sp.]
MKKQLLILAAAAVFASALTGCGSSAPSAPAASSAAQSSAAQSASAETPVTVKIGLTGTFNEDIWAPAAEELAAEGINLEFVQFSNFSLPNQALVNGEIDLNAFQHHAFLNNEVTSNGYAITPIGDTYIVAMNVYSNSMSSLDELKDGDQIAVPNDATNEGRALKLLESAGLLTIDPAAGASPEISDITDYKVQVKFVEMDANLVASALPDVAAAVINGNYALDSGLKADDAIFKETEYADDSYFGLIAARTEDAENPVYQRIVEAYQSQKTIDVFNDEFAGFFVPAWTL